MSDRQVIITYETLYEILRNEKYREELQKLDETFYKDATDYLKEKMTILNSQEQKESPFQNETEKTKKQLENIKKMLKEQGFDDKFIEVIQSHGYGIDEIPDLKNKQRKEKIEYALSASETLTGIIYAYAFMVLE